MPEQQAINEANKIFQKSAGLIDTLLKGNTPPVSNSQKIFLNDTNSAIAAGNGVVGIETGAKIYNNDYAEQNRDNPDPHAFARAVFDAAGGDMSKLAEEAKRLSDRKLAEQELIAPMGPIQGNAYDNAKDRGESVLQPSFFESFEKLIQSQHNDGSDEGRLKAAQELAKFRDALLHDPRTTDYAYNYYTSKTDQRGNISKGADYWAAASTRGYDIDSAIPNSQNRTDIQEQYAQYGDSVYNILRDEGHFQNTGAGGSDPAVRDTYALIVFGKIFGDDKQLKKWNEIEGTVAKVKKRRAELIATILEESTEELDLENEESNWFPGGKLRLFFGDGDTRARVNTNWEKAKERAGESSNPNNAFSEMWQIYSGENGEVVEIKRGTQGFNDLTKIGDNEELYSGPPIKRSGPNGVYLEVVLYSRKTNKPTRFTLVSRDPIIEKESTAQ